MKFVVILSLSLCVAGVARAQADGNSCSAHATAKCGEPGDHWESGSCNSVFGGFRGNANNLHQLMAEQFRDSFKMLLMASHFNSDRVNRMGLHKLLQDQSNGMWNKGKEMMKFILQRGGRIGRHFQVSNLNPGLMDGEVEALGMVLDTLKTQAEHAVVAHKHSMNKKVHDTNSELDSYDPSVAHFLEEEMLEPSSKMIREVTGYLNTLAKMARNANTKAMGIHLFDESLH